VFPFGITTAFSLFARDRRFPGHLESTDDVNERVYFMAVIQFFNLIKAKLKPQNFFLICFRNRIALSCLFTHFHYLF
jgi:hypothetical protein